MLDARAKYSDVNIYNPETITTSIFAQGQTFSSMLLRAKRDLLLKYCKGRLVLDLGCADGRHLNEISDAIQFGIGIDFSIPFIRRAVGGQESGTHKNIFLVGDVTRLPLKANSMGCIYSFATLYYIDEIERIYAEISRVLSRDGVALLEVGNSRSFATLVSRHFPDLASHSRMRISDHLCAIKENNLRIKEWRSFQILPFWGDRPGWLNIVFRRPWLERLAMIVVGGRMLDEWISSSRLFRRFAFRHLLVLERER